MIYRKYRTIELMNYNNLSIKEGIIRLFLKYFEMIIIGIIILSVIYFSDINGNAFFQEKI